MSPSTSPLELDQIGIWTQEFTAEVGLEHAQRYAAAINETLPIEGAEAVVPPFFAAVSIRKALHAATAQILPAELASSALIVHGEQDLHFTTHLRVGMTARTRAVPLGVRVGPAGTALLFELEMRDPEGALLNTQFHTSFLPGVKEGISAGRDVPDHRFPPDTSVRPPTATSTVRFDKDQTYRYADASGDHTPIHVDDAFARSRGLPGVIVHGLCTLSIVTRGLVGELAAGDYRRLSRIAVRFSRNVLPGQSLTSRIWAAPESGEYRFETFNDAGDRVLTHGLIRVGAGSRS